MEELGVLRVTGGQLAVWRMMRELRLMDKITS